MEIENLTILEGRAYYMGSTTSTKVPQLVSKKEIYIPIDQRELNEVDKMESKIKSIQEECNHEWRLIKPIYLQETLIKGIFIFYDAGYELKLRLAKNIINYLYNDVQLYRCVECGFTGVADEWNQ